MRDIRNRDPDNMTSGVLGIAVCLGPTGIVVVTRVCRVDGHKRHVAKVSAVPKGRWFGGIGLCDHRIREIVGNAVLMDRDKRNRFRSSRIPKPRYNTRTRQTHAGFWTGLFALDKLTIFGPVHGPFRDLPLFIVAFVDG